MEMEKSTILKIKEEINKAFNEEASNRHIGRHQRVDYFEHNVLLIKKVLKACISSDTVTIFLISVFASIFALCLRLGKFMALLILNNTSPRHPNHKIVEAYRNSLEGLGVIPDIFFGILVIVLISILIINSQENITRFKMRILPSRSEKEETDIETKITLKYKIFSLFQSVMLGLCLTSLDWSAAENISLSLIMVASLVIYKFRMWCLNYRKPLVSPRAKGHHKIIAKLNTYAWYAPIDVAIVALIYVSRNLLAKIYLPDFFIAPLTILLILYFLLVLWSYFWLIFEGSSCLAIYLRNDSDSSDHGQAKIDNEKTKTSKASVNKREDTKSFRAWLLSLWWLPTLIMLCITLYGFALNITLISLSRLPF